MATGPAASFRRRRLGRPAMSHTISIQGSARILRRLKCVTVRGVPTEGGGGLASGASGVVDRNPEYLLNTTDLCCQNTD